MSTGFGNSQLHSIVVNHTESSSIFSSFIEVANRERKRMDVFISRFPHIIEQIVLQLDNKSLRNCKEVKKLWQKYIDDKKISWIRIVQIPKALKCQETYLRMAAKAGQTSIFHILFDNEGDKSQFDIQRRSIFSR